MVKEVLEDKFVWRTFADGSCREIALGVPWHWHWGHFSQGRGPPPPPQEGLHEAGLIRMLAAVSFLLSCQPPEHRPGTLLKPKLSQTQTFEFHLFS